MRTFAAKQWRHWSIAGRHFLGLAQGVSLPGMEELNRDSVVYEWDGSAFVEHQRIASQWAYNWHSFTIGDSSFVAHAEHLGESVLYRWDDERLAQRGRGVYLYLPKLEHHDEARLWQEVFDFTVDALGLAPGSIRATILVETLPSAFQMDELLHALGEYAYGLNAGRWDYIFSMIKCVRDDPRFVLPDRADVKMTVPFMRAYTELLVRTCHARGTFAMGGMAALIPSRSDAAANQRAIDAVTDDKRREAADGFDGT